MIKYQQFRKSPQQIPFSSFGFLFSLLVGVSVAATTGRVVDRNGQALPGVTVTFDGQGLTGTTDALGHFSLGTVVGLVSPGSHSNSGKRDKETNHFTFTPGHNPTPLVKETFTLKGARLVLENENVPMQAPHPLRKQSAGPDTLYLTKTAYLAKRVAVANTGINMDVGDIILNANFTGTAEKYHGYDLFRFTLAGKNALVLIPNKVRAGSPWIFQTMFWDHKPLFDSIMAQNGYYVAFIDMGNTMGAPKAVAWMDSLYSHLTSKYGLSKKVNMFGISRGGLFMYNWARANISKISTMYGDGAVMDFVSWPCGCYGTGVGSVADWSSLKSDYGFASDSIAKAYTGNPYQNMQSFAAAKIPIIHVYGEIDSVVPPAENALRANDSLKAHGWQMKLLPKPKTGHVHGVTPADGGLPGQLDTLINFVLRNTSY